MNPRIGAPPLRAPKARLNNLTLMPGSALAQITRYQEMANELPDGCVLIVLPVNSSELKNALSTVAGILAESGHQVRVVSDEHSSYLPKLGQTQFNLHLFSRIRPQPSAFAYRKAYRR